MNIAFLYNSHRIIGGGEIGFTELIRRAIDSSGIRPLVLVPGRGELTEVLDSLGVPYRVFPFPSLRGAGFRHYIPVSLHLGRLMREERCDLIHANGARCMLYAGLAGRLARVPVLWHVRVLERDGMLDHIRSLLARRIICNSRAVASSLTPYVTAAQKTITIYNGVDQTPFRNACPRDLHAEFQIPRTRRIILIAALLVEWKGQRDVIEALRLMPGAVRETVHVVFAGRELEPGEPFTTELRKAAVRTGVAENITWAGHRRDLPELMHGADLLLLPSHGEPFGRVIVEAWAAGLPVLATETGGPGEIIESGKTGRLIPERSALAIAEAIPQMLSEPDLLRQLAENGRHRAGDFTLDKHAQAVFHCYKELTGPAMPGASFPGT